MIGAQHRRDIIQRLSLWGFVFTIVMSVVMITEIALLRNFAVGTFKSQEDRLVRLYRERRFFTIVLREADGSAFGLKYKDFPVARLCHMLPGAVWAVLAPPQFSAYLRRTWPRVHRITGRVFLLCSALIAIGLCSIIHNKLTFYTANTADLVFLAVMNAWFVATGYLAIARARKGDIRAHRVWILRHCAVGYFVFLQRVIMLCTRRLLMRVGFDLTVTANAKAWFHVCALVSAFLSITAIEVWLWATQLPAAKKAAQPTQTAGLLVKGPLRIEPDLTAERTPPSSPMLPLTPSVETKSRRRMQELNIS